MNENGKIVEFAHVELRKDTWIRPEITATTREEAIQAVGELICGLDREMVIQLNLTTRGRVINAAIVSIGTVNSSVVNPAEVMRSALVTGASRLILLHNHPSGIAEPSKEDRDVSKRIASAADMLGLTLDDFIIIGDDTIYSMDESDRDCLRSYRFVAEE